MCIFDTVSAHRVVGQNLTAIKCRRSATTDAMGVATNLGLKPKAIE